MRVRVHPIQRAFTTQDGTQTCDKCGAEEVWTAKFKPDLPQTVIARSLHLVHLVKAHLPDVQASLRDRKTEEWVDTEIKEAA